MAEEAHVIPARHALSFALVLSGASALVAPAAAQHYEEAMIPSRRSVESPEGFALELRGGPYAPSSDAVAEVYPDDSGPLLAVELDVMFLRIPYVGRAGIGSGIGWARLSDTSLDEAGMRTDEEIDLTLIPIPLVAVLRVDVLARELDIPLLLAGKIGLDMLLWDEDVGERQGGSGVAFGLRWGAEIALELDFFDRAAARSLDEEWGINHTYILFEYFGSTASDGVEGGTLELGDQTWAIGLGFLF